MPSIQNAVIDARDVFPGVITITPIPIETPILTRPVLHSDSLIVKATRLYKSTKPSSVDNFHWGTAVLLIFLALSFGVFLSKWGWRMMFCDSNMSRTDDEELIC